MTAAFPPLRTARLAQALLVTIGFVTAMDVHISKILIEPMKLELRLTDTQAGLINVTATSMAYAALAIPAGMLADRGNRSALLMLSVAMWSAGLMLVALSHSVAPLVAGKAALGAAQALTYTSALSLFSDLFAPEKRASAIATYPVGQIFGASGAVLAGGLGLSAITALATRDPGILHGLTPWRVITLAFGLASLLFLPFLLMMREPRRMETTAAARGRLRELWGHRASLIPIFAGIAFLSGLSNGVLIWAIPALMRLYGETPGALAAWMSPLSLVVGIAGTVLSGRIVDAAKRRGDVTGVLRIAAIAALVGGFANLMAVTPGVGWFAALWALAQLTYAIAVSVPVIVINFTVANQLRGLATGISVVLFALVGGVAAPLVGLVGEMLGGDAALGRAIAAVGLPMSLAASAAFWWAAPAGRERRGRSGDRTAGSSADQRQHEEQ